MSDFDHIKPVGLVLGNYHGVEKDILLHFSLAGYEMHHAQTAEESAEYLLNSDYDVIFLFEDLVDGPTSDYIFLADKKNLARVIALVEKGGTKYHASSKTSGISHFFYVRTNPAIL